MPCCYVGLGSNLADPIAQVTQAFSELESLSSVTDLVQSSLYRSAPVGPQDQPDFINAVAGLSTQLSPEALLDQLQAIEQLHQRVRVQHWGPRTLDLDLLLYGDQVLKTDRLTVPHPELTERAFVLLPLHELAPKLCLPDGRSIERLLDQCPLGSVERINIY